MKIGDLFILGENNICMHLGRKNDAIAIAIIGLHNRRHNGEKYNTYYNSWETMKYINILYSVYKVVDPKDLEFHKFFKTDGPKHLIYNILGLKNVPQ